MNERITEAMKHLASATISTGASGTTISTGYVSAKDLSQVLGVCILGNVSSGTIDFVLQQATTSTGAGVKTLKAATQLAASASANDNDLILIQADASDFDREDEFDYVRGLITFGATGAGSYADIELFGVSLRGPVAQSTWVAETKV